MSRWFWFGVLTGFLLLSLLAQLGRASGPPMAGDFGLPAGTPIDKGPYTVAFDARTKNPAWVCYVLTGAKRTKPIKRPNGFHEELLLPKWMRTSPANYVNSHYDQGHSFPFACALTDDEAYSSMSMINIRPQNPDNNQYIWGKKVEPSASSMAVLGETLVYVCDTQTYAEPDEDGNITIATIGEQHVHVPSKIVKTALVVDTPTKTPQGTRAWVADNEPIDHDVSEESLRLPVSEVQQLTGLDFYNLIPEPLQTQLESKQ